ncbi:MAG: hypothetical protein AB1432_11600 [Bacteroidota bacterium]
MKIDIPNKLAIELNKIDWHKVKENDIDILIKFGLPFLQAKGYLKNNSEVTNNEHTKENSSIC